MPAGNSATRLPEARRRIGGAPGARTKRPGGDATGACRMQCGFCAAPRHAAPRVRREHPRMEPTAGRTLRPGRRHARCAARRQRSEAEVSGAVRGGPSKVDPSSRSRSACHVGFRPTRRRNFDACQNGCASSGDRSPGPLWRWPACRLPGSRRVPARRGLCVRRLGPKLRVGIYAGGQLAGYVPVQRHGSGYV